MTNEQTSVFPNAKLTTSEKKEQSQEFRPKCPTCGSPDIEKITAANKVKNAALWGVFALRHLSKTYKCNNCDYKW